MSRAGRRTYLRIVERGGHTATALIGFLALGGCSERALIGATVGASCSPAPETCDDGIDNDCDQEIDEPSCTSCRAFPGSCADDPIVDIAARAAHACALRRSGSVLCWGRNSEGQLGDGTTEVRLSAVSVVGLDDAVQIAPGGRHSCALRAGGTVVCWGTLSGMVSTATPVEGLTDVTQVSAGLGLTCARRRSGEVLCWGENGDGMLGDGTTTARSTPALVDGIVRAEQVSAGVRHACARIDDGTARCWGDNQFAMLGDGTRDDHSLPVTVAGLDHATSITLGVHHTCAVRDDDTARCWGSDLLGELGRGGLGGSGPVEPVISEPIVQVQPSFGGTTCARHPDGRMSCWGNNASGTLGIGASGEELHDASLPMRVLGITDAVDIAIGTHFGCALHRTGEVSCWGRNDAGQLGDGTTTSRSTPSLATGPCPLVPLACHTPHEMTGGIWDACSPTIACAPGFSCGAPAGTEEGECAPSCSSDADCPGGVCWQGAGGGYCSYACDPFIASEQFGFNLCPIGETCFVVGRPHVTGEPTRYGTICRPEGDGAAGDPCDAETDCGTAGLSCIEGTCRELCHLALGNGCEPLSPPLYRLATQEELGILPLS